MDTDRSERIRRRAYELWQAAGSPRGDGEEFWLQAEAEVAQTDPVIDQNAPDAAARREVERENPETIAKIGARKKGWPDHARGALRTATSQQTGRRELRASSLHEISPAIIRPPQYRFAQSRRR